MLESRHGVAALLTFGRGDCAEYADALAWAIERVEADLRETPEVVPLLKHRAALHALKIALEGGRP